MEKFRLLNADEIECRVSTITEKGLTLLLYKDARVDQSILDETVGPMNWQRHHSRDNANCIVSIWDDEKKQWIEKEDTGKESKSEAEKGLASDSFKRACFNWGIGRELYSAPFIWIPESNYKADHKNGKPATYDKFIVFNISYDEKRNINGLTIKNERTGAVVYTLKKQPAATEKKDPNKLEGTKYNIVKSKCLEARINMNKLCKLYKRESLDQFTEAQLENVVRNFGQIKMMCSSATNYNAKAEQEID